MELQHHSKGYENIHILLVYLDSIRPQLILLHGKRNSKFLFLCLRIPYHLDGDLAILDVLNNLRTKAANGHQQKHGMKRQPSNKLTWYFLSTLL